MFGIVDTATDLVAVEGAICTESCEGKTYNITASVEAGEALLSDAKRTVYYGDSKIRGYWA